MNRNDFSNADEVCGDAVGARAVVLSRTSRDGMFWTNDSACNRDAEHDRE